MPPPRLALTTVLLDRRYGFESYCWKLDCESDSQEGYSRLAVEPRGGQAVKRTHSRAFGHHGRRCCGMCYPCGAIHALC